MTAAMRTQLLLNLTRESARSRLAGCLVGRLGSKPTRRALRFLFALLVLGIGASMGCKADPMVVDRKPKDMASTSDDAAMGCDSSRCENPDSQCCNGEPCIDVNSNPFHCGGCGKVCGNREVCAAGSCVCRGGGRDQVCSAGTLCCFDGCRDVMKDTMNCGGCNRVCVAGETCDGGTCKCGPAGLSCRSGQTCCGSGCSSLLDDPKNCGKCGKECPMGKACKGGVCEGECAVPCGGVERCCDGMCVNILNNPKHCGGCGRDCSVLSPFPIPGCLVGNCIDLRMMDMAMPADMSMPMDMSMRD